jgi:hypothetical protein
MSPLVCLDNKENWMGLYSSLVVLFIYLLYLTHSVLKFIAEDMYDKTDLDGGTDRGDGLNWNRKVGEQ